MLETAAFFLKKKQIKDQDNPHLHFPHSKRENWKLSPLVLDTFQLKELGGSFFKP